MGYLGLALSLLKGQAPAVSDAERLSYIIANADVEIDSFGHRTELMTAEGQPIKPGASQGSYLHVISMKDPIIKYDEYCGPTGTETLARKIRASADDPSCAGIILDVDSPGGAVNAVNNPSDAILYAKSKKPVVAYCGNGMTCSAAYWIACHCNEMYATFSADTIGSIGAYITLVDWEAAYKAYFGSDTVPVKVESIYASKSTAKNDGYRAWQNDNTKKLVTDHLDPFNELFINTVKAQRANVNEKVFTGATFMAEEALAMGLIDGIKSFQEVVDRTWELANGNSSNTNSNNSTAMFGKKSSVKVLLDAKAEERTQEMFAEANKESNAVGLTIVEAEAFANLQADAERKGTELTASQQALVASQQKLVAVCTALGLTATEKGTFTNAAGEEVDAVAHATTIASEREEFGKTAGKIETATTKKETELATEDAATEKLNQFYAGIDAKLS